MADTDILTLRTNGDFRNGVAVAVASIALGILVEPATTKYRVDRLAWARKALADPTGMAESTLWAVVVDAVCGGKADDPSKITEVEIKTAVANAVNGLYVELATIEAEP